MAFPKYEDFKAPWEEADEEVDAEKAKKLVYNARKAEHDATEKAKARAAEVEERDAALEAYKEAEKAAKRENETDLEKIKRENAELEKQLEDAKKDKGPARETLLLEVALEKGLTKVQAKRLVGDTLEELLADADEYLKDVKPAGDEEESGEQEDEVNLNRQPKVKRTPGDPGGKTDVDLGKAIEARRSMNPLIA